ncbi:radial spoke head protein 9 homolog [Hetaerina americana]|uniref:radial spoke head protein 9 homolog n=1 Tax=Hetaerina americana TaxID=62018 RepID=UPI003A7F2EE3
MLKCSLVILQNENHFRNVYFWGKIYGTDHNYYISYGYQKDALADIIFYYSTDCVKWGMLPSSSDFDSSSLKYCITPFSGDPALLKDSQNGFANEVVLAPLIKIKEEDRLAATISLINDEAMIVPRGALFKNVNGVVIENENFRGLNLEESKHLESYLHYRIPKNKWSANLYKRADFSYEMDFLDSIDGDVPKGCWSLQYEDGGQILIVRNLFWPGMTFIHVIGTSEYYFNYTGDGKKNIDVPFML